MRLGWCLFLLVLALPIGCKRQQPQELQVGTHAISVLAPREWEHFDYGERHHFRKDFERISIEDLDRLGKNLDKAAQRALVLLRENDRRSVASSHHFQIDGRDAVTIDTWDRLSHQYRKRYVFVNNERKLLAIYMMQGKFETMEATYDDLLASIAFVDTLVLAGSPISRGRD